MPDMPGRPRSTSMISKESFLKAGNASSAEPQAPKIVMFFSPLKKEFKVLTQKRVVFYNSNVHIR